MVRSAADLGLFVFLAARRCSVPPGRSRPFTVCRGWLFMALVAPPALSGASAPPFGFGHVPSIHARASASFMTVAPNN